jgi:WD40 repeat protein
MAPVKSGGLWGYIDRTGSFVIPPQFDQAYSFSDGLAGVQVGEKRGFILSDGSFAAEPQFDDFWRHDGGVVPVRVGDLWGIIAPAATDPATRLNLPLAALAQAQQGRDTGFSLQPSNPHYYIFQDIASVHSVSVTPDQSVMLTTLALQSYAEIALWDFQSHRLIRKFPVPEATQAMLLPDTQIVAVGLSTGHLLLMDAVTGVELHRIRPVQGAVLDLVLSPDATRLAVTDGAAVQVWDAQTGAALFTLTTQAQKLRFSADSTRLFAGNLRGGLATFDRDGAELARIPDGPPLEYGEGPFFQAVPSMALTSQGVLVNLRVRSEQQADGLYQTFSTLEVVSAEGRREIPLTEGVGDILTLDVSADGRFVAYSGAFQDNFVAVLEIRDLQSGAVMFQQKLDRGPEAEAAGLTRGIYSMDRLAFTPDGALVLVGGEGQDILVLDPEKGRVTGSFGDRLTAAQQGAAQFDGTRFFSTDGGGQVWVWDLAQGRLETRVQTSGEGYGVEEMIYVEKDQFFIYSGMEDTGFAGFDMATLQPIEMTPEEESYVFERRETTEPVTLPDDVSAKLEMIGNGFGGVVLAGGRLAVKSESVGLHQVYDLNTGALLAQFLSTPDGEWLVLTPEGFFAASKNGAQLVSVSNGLRAFSVDQVYQALYRPDLVQAKLAGDPDGIVARAAAELDLGRVMGSGAAPITRFSFPAEGFKAPDPEIEIEIELQDEGGGIGRVEWRVNGVTVQVQPTRAAEALDEDTPKASARVALDPGQNVIEVVAYNAAGLLASAPRQVTVTWDGVASTEPPALHVLAVGVNDYADGRLQLKYAAADAQAFADAMKKAGAGLFASVDVVTLLDGDVTDASLDAAFAAMGETVKPQDVFVFFLAGHGKTIEGKYYFIPQDFRFEGDDPIRAGGIGQDRWQEWAARVRAKKSVMIYDTCESGSLTGSRSVDAAMAQTAAVERLTRAMGRTILSASTDDAPALEGYQGHGVMTWAMLDALGSGDLNGNATLEVTELASYLDMKVPEISSAAFGFRQVPQMSVQGSDFALGSAVAVLGDAPETFPATLSHVVAGGTQVRDAPDGAEVLVIEAGVFYGVFKIEERDGFARIAKDGRSLGWVPVAALTPLQ